MKFNAWDYVMLKYFVIITAFCNILVIVELLGDPRFHFSTYTRLALSGSAIFQGVFTGYFVIRMIMFIHSQDKKEEDNKYNYEKSDRKKRRIKWW